MTAIRAGLARSACEVNRISGQQHEPTEASMQIANRRRNPCSLGWGGCQGLKFNNNPCETKSFTASGFAGNGNGDADFAALTAALSNSG